LGRERRAGPILARIRTPAIRANRSRHLRRDRQSREWDTPSGRITMGENNNDDSSDGSTSEDSNVALLFNKAAADVKAGMAASSSDDDDQQDQHAAAGIQLYYSGEATDGRDEDAKIRRAARDRKRRAANAKLNSDDEDDDEVSFVPKSQAKKTPIRRSAAAVAAAAPARESVSLLTIMDSSDEEESPQVAAGSAAGLDEETTRRLSELRYATKRVNSASLLAAQQPRSPIDVDASRHRRITVKIDGSTDSACFTLEESNSIKDVIARCAERFKIDLDTPIGLYHENRLLHNSDLLFDVPVQCTLIAKVHRKMQRVKEAPKGTMMRLNLRGPDGEKEIKIGSLQPLQVALDQYGGAAKGLKFDGEMVRLDRPPGAYDMDDDDLIDVV
jgi:hypothetical protein